MWFHPDLTQNLNCLHIFWLEQNNLLSELWSWRTIQTLDTSLGFRVLQLLDDMYLKLQPDMCSVSVTYILIMWLKIFMELVSHRLRNSIPDTAGQLDTLWHVPDSVDSLLESPFLFFQCALAMELASVHARITPGGINRAAPIWRLVEQVKSRDH